MLDWLRRVIRRRAFEAALLGREYWKPEAVRPGAQEKEEDEIQPLRKELQELADLINHEWGTVTDATHRAGLVVVKTDWTSPQDTLTDVFRGYERIVRHLLAERERATRPVDRERLAAERSALTHRFALEGEGERVRIYVTAGMYADGRLGEVFIVADRQGSFVSGLFDCIATLISIALQHGVPLRAITGKMRHTRFPPANVVQGAHDIPAATSVLDYLAAWLDSRYPDGAASAEVAARDLIGGERFDT